jgi:hypothetical protein
MALAPYVDSQQTGISGIPIGDGMQIALNADNFGNQKMNAVGGQWMEWCRRGYVFTAYATAGGAILDFIGTLTNAPVLWNRLSQGKIFVPMILNCMWAGSTTGNVIEGNLALGYISNAGDNVVATQIATMTSNTPFCNIIGRNVYSATGLFSATAGFATAAVGLPRPFFTTGAGFTTPTTGTNATTMGNPFHYVFNGEVQVAPGGALVFGLDATIATALTVGIFQLIYAELPIFAGY